MSAREQFYTGNFADVFICHENVYYIGIFASIINIFYKCETMFYFILIKSKRKLFCQLNEQHVDFSKSAFTNI